MGRIIILMRDKHDNGPEVEDIKSMDFKPYIIAYRILCLYMPLSLSLLLFSLSISVRFIGSSSSHCVLMDVLCCWSIVVLPAIVASHCACGDVIAIHHCSADWGVCINPVTETATQNTGSSSPMLPLQQRY